MTCLQRLTTKREELAFISFIQVVIVLMVIGFLLWLVKRFIPMTGSIKAILPLWSLSWCSDC
jgi:flagellar biogenesis protein FliO